MKVLIKGPTGQNIEALFHGKNALIGRSPKCDVVVSHESFSRKHCKIDIENGQFFITDLGSANGVFLDGKRIEANTKTLFKSCNKLQIGIMDCTVEDTEPDSSDESPHSLPINSTRTYIRLDKILTKRFNQNALVKPLKMTIHPDRSELKRIVISLSVGTLLSVLIIFSLVSKEPTEEKVVVEEPAEAIEVNVKPESTVLKSASNKFRLPQEYNEIFKLKTCEGSKNYCMIMNLDEKFHEGLWLGEGEAIVFINATRHLKLETYKNVKLDPRILDLLSLSNLLTSPVMDDYLRGELAQIHLAVENEDGKILKVYRFHPEVAAPDKFDKLGLISILTSCLRDGNSEPFWEKFGDVATVMHLSDGP